MSLSFKDRNGTSHKVYEDGDYVIRHFRQDNIEVVGLDTPSAIFDLPDGYDCVSILNTSLNNATNNGQGYSGFSIYRQAVINRKIYISVRHLFDNTARIIIECWALLKKKNS